MEQSFRSSDWGLRYCNVEPQVSRLSDCSIEFTERPLKVRAVSPNCGSNSSKYSVSAWLMKQIFLP